MYILKTILFVFVLLISLLGVAQNTCFHKVYAFDDTLGIISNVYVNSDTTYLIDASTGRYNRTSASIVTLNVLGEEIEKITFKDSLRDESIGFSASEIYMDENSVFWFVYTSYNESNWESYPKILKYHDITNNLVKKEIDTLVDLYLTSIDRSRLIVDEESDRYFLAMKYNYSENIDTTSNLPWDTGTNILCYSIITDSLIYIKRHNFSTYATNKPRRIMYNYLPYSNGKHLLIQGEDYDNTNFNSQYCKILFKTIDPSDGSVISTKQLQDTPWSMPGFGASFINDEKDLLISYTESDTLMSVTNQPYYAVRPTVARLDSNFNVVWKDTLRTYFSSTLYCGGCVDKFALQGDSTFVGAHSYVDVKNEGEPNQSIYYTMRITNRNQLNGTVNWNRDYSYYPIIGQNYIANYEIHDVENTIDGGYIFVGESTNFDSLNANAPGQLGYVLKTNCLGFLDDPQAGFTAVPNDSMGVHFTNTSLMGGSYLWDFGDGASVLTGEFDSAAFDSAQAAVFHTYSDTGIFEVTLIAYGCNGANDTLTTSIHISKNVPEEPVNPNITNYMAIGPNPVQSGESIAVYVGNLPSENCTLSFYDERGKVVLEHRIALSHSTNIIVIPFSSGVYQVVLRDGSKELEVEKVIVI